MRFSRMAAALAAVALAGAAWAAKVPDLNPEDWTWYNGTNLTVEGKGWAETVYPYGRLPGWAKEKATPPVWGMSVNATGVNVRFVPYGKKLYFRWKVPNPKPQDGWMSAAAVTGIDVYSKGPDGWRFRSSARYFGYGKDRGGEYSLGWAPGTPCMVYLPLRSRVESFEVGVEKGGRIEPLPRHPVSRRVVHYGTSIVHGGCVSRPGMAFANREGRLADVEVVNLGFSGAGKMEMGMCDVVSSIDAGLYVLDCDWNMGVPMQKERYEPFVRELRKRRPGVPILLCGGCTQFAKPREQEVFAKSVFEKLKAEDPVLWKDLHFLSGVDMLPKDDECTFDFCHPNDYGSVQMGRVYAEAITAILGKAK